MSNASESSSLQLVSLRTISAQGGETFEWHSHPFEEFTFVTDDHCLIGYPPGWRPTAPNTLIHYHAGEKHGAAASLKQHPRFWVIHFAMPTKHPQELSALAEEDSARRVWSLTPEQSGTFQWIFLQLLNERSACRPHLQLAAGAWLQLLLVNVQRWADRSAPATSGMPAHASGEVLRLWHLVNEAVGKPYDELKTLYAAPNYDSTRHAFRKAFGFSPREMLLRLRMEHAKNLLLESSLSIKEISARVGYVLPHDFNRFFQRYAGVAPSQWRSNPLARTAKG